MTQTQLYERAIKRVEGWIDCLERGDTSEFTDSDCDIPDHQSLRGALRYLQIEAESPSVSEGFDLRGVSLGSGGAVCVEYRTTETASMALSLRFEKDEVVVLLFSENKLMYRRSLKAEWV